MDVDEPRHEVGVARARARPQLDLDRAGDLEVARERLALVDEHVVPRLERALVEGPEPPLVRVDDRVGRIVDVAVRGLAGSLGGSVVSRPEACR